MKPTNREVQDHLLNNENLTPEMIARIIRTMQAMLALDATPLDNDPARSTEPAHSNGSPGRYSHVTTRDEKTQAAERLGMTPRGIDMRIKRGWDRERALNEPKSTTHSPDHNRPAEEEVRLSPSQSFALLELAAHDVRIADFDNVHDQHVWTRLMDKLVDRGFALRHKGNHFAISRRGAWAAGQIAPATMPVRHESSTNIRKTG